MKGKRSNEQILLLYRLDCYNQFLQYQETAKVKYILIEDYGRLNAELFTFEASLTVNFRV